MRESFTPTHGEVVFENDGFVFISLPSVRKNRIARYHRSARIGRKRGDWL